MNKDRKENEKEKLINIDYEGTVVAITEDQYKKFFMLRKSSIKKQLDIINYLIECNKINNKKSIKGESENDK